MPMRFRSEHRQQAARRGVRLRRPHQFHELLREDQLFANLAFVCRQGCGHIDARVLAALEIRSRLRK